MTAALGQGFDGAFPGSLGPGAFPPGPFPGGPGAFPGGPGGPGGVPGPEDDEAQELQRARFRSQFRKTEMCRYFRSGCRNGSACQYAHGDHELTGRPDLTKTSLCRRWAKNSCPLSPDECRFAHGASDLRVTAQYEKIALCKAFVHGRCKLGASCRFAHSAGEINQDQAPFAGVGNAFYGGGPGDHAGMMMQSQPWPGSAEMFANTGGWPQQAFPPWMAAGGGSEGMQGGGEGQQEFQPFMMPGSMMMPYMQMPGASGAGAAFPPSLAVPGGGGFPQEGAPDPIQGATPVPAQVPKKADVQLVVKSAQGGTVKFKIKTTMPLRKLMDSFCSRKTLTRSQVKFSVGGREIQQEDTASKLGLTDDSVIDAEVFAEDDANA